MAIIAACVWAGAAGASGGIEASDAKDASPGAQAGNAAITRTDFAAAYLRFELAMLEASIDGVPGAALGAEETARVNREFDAVTLLFFSRDYAPAIRRLNELTASLRREKEVSAARNAKNAAASLAVRVTPQVYAFEKAPAAEGSERDGGAAPAPSLSLRVESIYPFSGDRPDKDALAVEFRRPAAGMAFATSGKTGRTERPVARLPFRAEFAADGTLSLELPFEVDRARFVPGIYDVGIAAGDAFIRTGTWTVVRESLDAVRERNEARLAALRIDPASPEQEGGGLDDAFESVKARNGLLADSLSPDNTAQAVLDLAGLAAQVEAEIEALARGVDPFRTRSGDTWRVVRLGDRRAPVRVYAPKAAATSTEPVPLVVAFHGAGGDENMFMEGYGAGLINRLAEEYGVIVASPYSNMFVGAHGPALFDRMLAVLSAEYPVDGRRVYLIGHSMGASVVSRLAAARAEKIAAGVCLAGFTGFGESAEKTPPVLVIAAELDPLAAPSRIEPVVRRAANRGLPVEYRIVEGYGHTLVVARELPAVFEWLLRR